MSLKHGILKKLVTLMLIRLMSFFSKNISQMKTCMNKQKIYNDYFNSQNYSLKFNLDLITFDL